MKALCIGGEKDGQYIYLRNPIVDPFIQIVKDQYVPKDLHNTATNKTTFESDWYQKETFYFEGKEFIILRHPSITLDEAHGKLFTKYKDFLDNWED